ncbi:MAG: transcription antitermination factor NusB, partial [Butyrivibrio sp.]|nr:transcription antitermination factor NusB [Butyrivibrio sp.]
IRDKYEKIAAKLPEIDEAINKETTGWDTDRMAKVDLTIIRLALYEIKYDDSVPTGVAINEAVELAKKFGQDGSPSFVNGVLAKFAK